MCTHLDEINDVQARTPDGCEECLAAGEHDWFHLRMCLTCGHVGCCDSSPHKHASAHFEETGHAIVRSFQPGEDWGWCFADMELLLADELISRKVSSVRGISFARQLSELGDPVAE